MPKLIPASTFQAKKGAVVTNKTAQLSPQADDENKWRFLWK